MRPGNEKKLHQVDKVYCFRCFRQYSIFFSACRKSTSIIMSILPSGHKCFQFKKHKNPVFLINDIFAETMILNPPMGEFTNIHLKQQKCHEKKKLCENSCALDGLFRLKLPRISSSFAAL